MNEIRTISQLLDALKQGYTVFDGQVVPRLQPHAAQDMEKAERHFCISIANHVFDIKSLYPDTFYLCRHYLSDLEPEMQVVISEDDIIAERKETEKNSIPQSNGYLETLVVYRKICEKLLIDNTILMHGAVVASGGAAYMFTAESGTGKTTHIKKWLDNAENSYVINGDKPLIHISENQVTAYGSPWCG